MSSAGDRSRLLTASA